jgi:apolipoprotein N-acyltransferase
VRGIHHRAWLLSLLSAFLQVLIFPLPGFYVLCWIALAPLLVALLRSRSPEALHLDTAGIHLLPARPWQGFLLGYICGIVWYGGTCYWVFDTMRQYGGLNVAMSAFLLLLFCMTAGLGHGLFGVCFAVLASRTTTQRYALVLAPSLWVAVELTRTHLIDFSWNLLGTVQVDNIPLARMATVTGVYGISFEIVLVNAALATVLLLPRDRRTRLLMMTLAVAALLQAGRWLPQQASPSDHRAVLLQENVPVAEASPWTVDYFQQTIRQFSDLSMAAPASGMRPDLIVWPESSAPFLTRDPLFREALSNTARQAQAWMLVGSIGLGAQLNAPMGALPVGAMTDHANAAISASAGSDAVYNSAVLVSPTGEWTARYDKARLVAFGEYVPLRQFFSFADALTKEVGTFDHGVSRQPLQAGSTRLGVFICYESVFPEDVRQFAANGAQVFVNISNDGWYGDSGAWAQHLQQARMRAVENDRWLLRDTNTGLTAAIDPLGRVVASIPRNTRSRLEAPYALIDATTFYTRHGNCFALACAIISLVALLASLLLRDPQKHDRRTRTRIRSPQK